MYRNGEISGLDSRVHSCGIQLLEDELTDGFTVHSLRCILYGAFLMHLNCHDYQ